MLQGRDITMYRNSTRIIISVICVGLAGYSVFQKEYIQSLVFLLCAAASLLLLLAYGTVYRAGKLCSKGEFEKARDELDRIKSPHLLFRSQRGYYYLFCGTISLQNNELEAAEDSFRRALLFKLRTAHDNNLLLYLLTVTLTKSGQKEEADIFFKKIDNPSQFIYKETNETIS